ncbi:hypothetical protein C7M23_02231 [Bacillus subtilis]|uniref:hypothetical protein n=1 Tax=Bacillus subtilis TaxID=1423 RepID=UPI001367582A|nr:hypothetical protein [Bacillus subtilis]QHL55107.1 hypothetical protein C7M23_02231 [Bacillus subtilis]
MGDEEVILSKTESLWTLNLQHLRCLFGVRFLFEKGDTIMNQKEIETLITGW